jgi:hypothetical protein
MKVISSEKSSLDQLIQSMMKSQNLSIYSRRMQTLQFVPISTSIQVYLINVICNHNTLTNRAPDLQCLIFVGIFDLERLYRPVGVKLK